MSRPVRERGKATCRAKGQPSKEGQRTHFDKGVQGRCHRVGYRKGRVMREARTILQLLRERGQKRLPLERVYRLLFNPNLYLMAYGEIYHTWVGTVWFIEGDISKCFDALSHERLLSILRETIKDEQFIRLISGLLKAGYLEEWRWNQTYSGSPQGGLRKALHNPSYAK